MARVLVLLAHPYPAGSRVHRRLHEAIRTLDATQVAVRDLYALYPDFAIDVAAEQAALAEARLVVWQHPIYWYSMPALMKLWLDEVHAYGWAYGSGARALAGKDLWLVASTGGSEGSYAPGGHHQQPSDSFLRPYEQTAAVCGMRFLPPLVAHGAHRLDPERLDAHAAAYAERLASYPDWPELQGPDAPDCPIPPDERPARWSGRA